MHVATSSYAGEMKRVGNGDRNNTASASTGVSRPASDTSEDVELMFCQRVAAMSPAERALIADRLSRDVISAAKAGIMASGRFPTSEQVHRELVRRLHGDELADQYFAQSTA